MIKLVKTDIKWWQKPLISFQGKLTTAELAILSREMYKNELGVWKNSKSLKTGVVGIKAHNDKNIIRYKTERIDLPIWVSRIISDIHHKAHISKGCPDLIIWRIDINQLRMAEVKCPHWDRTSKEQDKFIKTARSLGINVKIIEWEFN